MNDAYWLAYGAKERRKGEDDIRGALNWAAGYTPEENGAYHWIKMIVWKNWPVTSVDDPLYRSLFRYTHKFS